MARIRTLGGNGHKRRRRVFDFTVVLIPVRDNTPVLRGAKAARTQNPTESGYQVTVPLLPGVITYGRTEEEALEMATDAIRCHLDGLRKSGEEIPDEKRVHTAKLRIALSA
jgi:antitoxin HicB